jgi:guanylate kinase
MPVPMLPPRLPDNRLEELNRLIRRKTPADRVVAKRLRQEERRMLYLTETGKFDRYEEEFGR